MRFLAAYLLANLGGNENPSVEDISSILKSVGVKVDQEEAKKVVSELNGKSINDLIAKGSSKLASMPSGGAAPSAAVSSASAPAAGGKKEESKKEPEPEEEEGDMGFGLFD